MEQLFPVHVVWSIMEHDSHSKWHMDRSRAPSVPWARLAFVGPRWTKRSGSPPHLNRGCAMDEFVEAPQDAPYRLRFGDAEPIAVARPIESQASLSIAEAEMCRAGDLGSGGGNAGFSPEVGVFQVCSEATSRWTRKGENWESTCRARAEPK